MEQTIAAIATATAPGGIGIIRISGEQARVVANKVFRPAGNKNLLTAKGYTALYGHVVDDKNQVVDEVVALIFAAPKSYTGEDVVELSCHGGLAILRKILRLVLQNGARMAQAGEFTKRAFLNGKMDLTQAEAVMDLVSAKGEQAAVAATAAHEGALSKKLQSMKETLVNTAAWLAAWADFPEEDIPQVEPEALLARLQPSLEEMRALIAGFDAGRMMRSGIETVIVGSPNVGKSTLMNGLSGHESSIVTHIPGTTRDIVSEEVQLGDLLLHLNDTAGIRDTDDTVEQVGVERAKNRLETAELVFAVLDSSRPLTPDDKQLLEDCKGKKTVVILNKSDLTPAFSEEDVKKIIPHVVTLSAKNREGMQELERTVIGLFALQDFDAACGMLFNERQLQGAKSVEGHLVACMDSVKDGVTLDAVSVMLDDALEALMELSGQRVTEEVANQIFHSFCVGK